MGRISDAEEVVIALGRIERAINERYGDEPGVVEGGFMQLHDKLDDVVCALDKQNEHLSKIAEALVYMTRAVE